MTKTNKAANKSTTELMLLTFKVAYKVGKDSTPTLKDYSFDNSDKLTKQIANFLDKQETRCTIHLMGGTFEIAGKTGTNKGERNFTFLRNLLAIVFRGAEDKTVSVNTWLTKNLATSFKVPSHSLHCFMTIIGQIQGITRDIASSQKLSTEIMNAPIFKARVKTSAELKALREEHKKVFLLVAPKQAAQVTV